MMFRGAHVQINTVILAMLTIFACTQRANCQTSDSDLRQWKKGKYRVYGPISGVSGNAVFETDYYTVSQSKNGFIQTGGEKQGLSNWDGVNFKSMVDWGAVESVTAILNDNEHFYFAGYNEFGYINNSAFDWDRSSAKKFIQLNTQLPDSEKEIGKVAQILAHRNGAYFVGAKKIYHFNKSLKVINQHGILGVVNDEVYIWKKGVGLTKLNGLPSTYKGPKDLDVVTILSFAHKVYLVTKSQGIYLYKDGQSFLMPSSVNPYLFSQEIICAIEKDKHRLFLGTQKGEILILDTNALPVTIVNGMDGLPEHKINDLFFDASGHLWVAMHGGLYAVDYPHPMSFVDKDFGFHGTPKAISEFNSHLYVATSKGLFSRKLLINDDPTYDPFFYKDSEIDAACWSLCSTEDALFIASSTGLFIKNLIGTTKLSDLPCSSLLQSSTNPKLIFVGTSTGLWLLKQTKHGWGFDHKMSAQIINATNMAQDNEKRLWIGSRKGGWIVDLDNKETTYRLDQMWKYSDLPEEQVIHQKGVFSAMTVGNETFFQNEGGYAVFKGGDSTLSVPDKTFPNHLPFNGQGSFYTHFSNSGEYYFTQWNNLTEYQNDDSTNGVLIDKTGSVVRHKNGHTHWSADLRRNGGFDVAYFASDGALYYGFEDEKLFMYDGSSSERVHANFRTNISHLYVSQSNQNEALTESQDKPIYSDVIFSDILQEGIKFSYNSINFFFTGVGSPPDKAQRYLCSLQPKGGSIIWETLITDGNRIYNNLAPGVYVFRVKAFYYQDRLRVMAKEDRYEFKILPPWYWDNWAIALYALLALLAGILAIRLNAIRLKKQKARLKEIVKSRTKEIQAQKKQMETMMLDTVHRTKGHIQLTKNLLEMQARRMKNLGAQAALNDAKGRLDLLEKLQKQILQTPQGELISSTAFFTDIANGLRQAYGFGHQGFQIQLHIDERPLPPDEATYLGLLASEIMMNAFKYAFNDHPSPCLRLAYKTDDSGWSLIISDNGPGIDHVDKRDSYGQELIRLFAEQLEAELSVYNNHGTVFELIVKQSTVNPNP